MKMIRKFITLCFIAALAAMPVAGLAQDKAPAKADKAKAEAKVDINTATAGQLAKLPGISLEIAHKIIAARPFANKAQLKSKNIITGEQYSAIENLVVARQPKKEGDKQGGTKKGKDNAKDKKTKD